MSEFFKDTAFRTLLVIGIIGIVFWSTYGHALAYYEDSLRATYGDVAFEDGFRMAHLHGLSNSLAAAVSAIALPLIVSLGRRLKTAIAAILGISLVFWNLGYTYAALTTSPATEEAFNAAKSNATTMFLVPISWLASITGIILLLVLLYDLIRKKS